MTLNLLGQRFTKLVVIEKLNEKSNDGKYLHLCLCDCGNKTKVTGSGLKSGNTKSCGCYQKERVSQYETTHGESVKGSVTAEYRIWQGMKNRCYNLKSKDYKYYGKRGIKICESWLNSYETFLKDMGRRTTQNHTIDRIDPNKDYSPENCRWIPNEEQVNTRRSTILYEYNGQLLTLNKIAEQLNVSKGWFRKKANQDNMTLEEVIKFYQNRKNIKS